MATTVNKNIINLYIIVEARNYINEQINTLLNLLFQQFIKF